jgi:hypothetical protein
MSSVTLILVSLNYKERHMFMSLQKNTDLIVRTACLYFQELLVPISKMATSVIISYDE